MKTIYKNQKLILMMTLFFISKNLQSQIISQGPLNPSIVTEQFYSCLSCPGSIWMNPMNAMLADSMNATTLMSAYSNCFQTTCFYSRTLMPQNFGFNIPSMATITGIKAGVLRKSSGYQIISDTIVQLLKNGNAIGTNKANSSYWTPVAVYELYGDSTDLWGTTWTPLEINSSSFGLFFKPINRSTLTTFVTAYIDHVQLTVYYTNTTGVQEQQQGTTKIIYDNSSATLFISNADRKISKSLLEIYDDAGKLVIKKYFEKETLDEKINLSDLSKGIYFAKLLSGDKNLNLKFLIHSQ